MIFVVFYVWSLIALTLCYKTPVFYSWFMFKTHLPHKPLSHLPDWFHRLLDIWRLYSAQQLYLFAWCVRLSSLLSVGFWTHLNSMQFHFKLLFQPEFCKCSGREVFHHMFLYVFQMFAKMTKDQNFHTGVSLIVLCRVTHLVWLGDWSGGDSYVPSYSLYGP